MPVSKTKARAKLKPTNEDLFLQELLNGKARWTAEADKLSEQGKVSLKEQEYAEAYRVLLNRFTKDPDPELKP